MQAPEILSVLNRVGVTARVSADKLVVEPGSKVPPELVPEIREHKAELLGLIDQRQRAVGDGRMPLLDHPPETGPELRRLVDYLTDPTAFGAWFERLMRQTDPAEEDHEEVEEWPVP